ncbi:uncharacterized protein LOC119732158 [Patiria miniata]|uniref:Uncharacterized protein n=1 Tax=Patiria miniata TaxID=46514 RepID=A0A914AC50_PATMI|nr:uncharacterized protein LOC119732158 [Patiria miniata]
MAFIIASKCGCVPVLVFFTCWLWIAHAHNANGVLSSDYSDSMHSSSSDDYDGIIVEPSDVYDVIMTSSDLSSTSSDTSSSVDEPTDPVDTSYVPSDSAGESSAASSLLSADVIICPSATIDELSSDVSSSSASSSLSSGIDLSDNEEPSVDNEDPPYVPPTDYESSRTSSSDVYPQSLEKKTAKSGSEAAGKPKRGPASLDDSSPDSNGKGKPGRPPAVFNGPRREDGTTRREGHGKRIVPAGVEDGTDAAGRKPARGGKPAQENGKGPSSKRPGRQWGGPPSIQRRKELREADTKYLDMYLCGQFFTETAADFAVVSFNYAGRTQPFSPCSELGSTSDTINYIYRAASGDRSALQQVLDDLPATWERYIAEKGAAPRIVHVFTVNMPASRADVSSLIGLRHSDMTGPARFVLGYLNQPTSSETHSAREFLDMLGELTDARIDPLRVCGRCAKVAGYPAGGRRRRDMLFGMSVVSGASTEVQCLPLQEHSIPGADLTTNTCDGFQKSIVRCTLRSIERRCRGTGSGTDSPRIDSDDETDLIDSTVIRLTQECAVDSDCWRRVGESIRLPAAPKSQNRCNMPEIALSKILGRCAAAAASLPFNVDTELLDRQSRHV